MQLELANKQLPTLLPEMDKKELFNKLQESEPIANLVDKKFKILGIIPEIVQVPLNNGTSEDLTLEAFATEEPLVDRLRVKLITDIGIYHSFSVTFNKALGKAIEIFGNDFIENTYAISAKLKGSGKEAKAYYVLKVL